MQGLLKNPLADGSTLGVASGASLGAVVAIAFGITIPAIPFAGTMVLAIVFAFLSLLIILSLAYKIDYSMSTNTIILIGVIYSMFVSSILALIISFASRPRQEQITFWTMGRVGYQPSKPLVLLVALVSVRRRDLR
jgi:iron complex transport system permease protein